MRTQEIFRYEIKKFVKKTSYFFFQHNSTYSSQKAIDAPVVHSFCLFLHTYFIYRLVNQLYDAMQL